MTPVDVPAADLKHPATDGTGSFVAHSQICVPLAGAATLVDAFTGRLGEVEHWPGFHHLEVWQDERDASKFVMVSWWDSQEDFSAYMRSASHRRSHDRITQSAGRPHPTGFTRYRVVAR